jgi:hypothetical protein
VSIKPGRVQGIFDVAEKLLENLISYLAAQGSSVLHRAAIVEAGVDARVFYFGHKVIGVIEGVRGLSDQTVQHQVNPIGSEESGDQVSDGTGEA